MLIGAVRMVNLTRDSRSSQEVRSARRGIQILGLWNCPDSQKRQETVSVEVSHVTLISIESDVGVEVQRTVLQNASCDVRVVLVTRNGFPLIECD